MINDTYSTVGMKPLIPLAFERAVTHTPLSRITARFQPNFDLSKFGRVSTSRNRWASRNPINTNDCIIRCTRSLVDPLAELRVTVDVLRETEWRQNNYVFADTFMLNITLVDLSLMLRGIDESVYTNTFRTDWVKVPANVTAEEYFTQILPDEFNSPESARAIREWIEMRRDMFTILVAQAPKYL